MAGGFMVY